MFWFFLGGGSSILKKNCVEILLGGEESKKRYEKCLSIIMQGFNTLTFLGGGVKKTTLYVKQISVYTGCFFFTGPP